MRTPRFFQDTDFSVGQEIILNDEATQHVCRALRMKPGENIALFNGRGVEALCEITLAEKRKACVSVHSVSDISRSSPLRVEIGQAISRGERMDYAVQKATELGMHSLTPLFTERCEVRLSDERQEKRIRHWQQVAISACEQSLRNEVPMIQAATTLSDWLTDCECELKLVLHHHTEQPLGDLPKPTSVALLIGPEGGLTETEVEAAINAGFKPVALGPRVMRTETAPVAAQAILHYLWGDLG